MLSVLKIRGKDGNFIPINAIGTDDGKHRIDTENPHKVTAKQVGALSKVCEYSVDLNVQLEQETGTVSICSFDEKTVNTPIEKNCTGIAITYIGSEGLIVQLAVIDGGYGVYTRYGGGDGVLDEWNGTGPAAALSLLEGDVENLAIRIEQIEEELEKLRTTEE